MVHHVVLSGHCVVVMHYVAEEIFNFRGYILDGKCRSKFARPRVVVML